MAFRKSLMRLRKACCSGPLPQPPFIGSVSVTLPPFTLSSEAENNLITSGNLSVTLQPFTLQSTGSQPLEISVINADGWTGEWGDGTPPTFDPVNNPKITTLSRQGFLLGNPTVILESVVATARVRQPAPNDATLTPSTVAVSDFVYSTDSAPGLVNNSAIQSPKPSARWLDAPRRSVQNILSGEISAEHRDGIDCIKVTATSGAFTVTQTITATQVSGRAGDHFAVEVWKYALDVSGFPAGLITLSAKVYPRIGAGDSPSGSVLRSEDQPIETRLFCNQIYVKVAPHYMYVDAVNGNDATAAANTDPVAAKLTPALTTKGAIERARATMPGNLTSGLEVRLGAGTWVPASITFNTYQNTSSAEIIITRDPDVPRANVIWSYTVTPNWYHNYVRFQDITIARGANVSIGANLASSAGGQVVFRDCDINNGGFNSAIVTTYPQLFEGGIILTNNANNTLSAAQTRMLRGTAVTGSVYNVWADLIVGCSLLTAAVQETLLSPSVHIISSLIMGPGGNNSSVPFGIGGQAGTLTGLVFKGNVIEYRSTQANTGFRVSADGALANTDHAIIRNNTIVGQKDAGRANLFYDETTGTTRRAHTRHRVEGNVFGQLNTKSDRFVYIRDGAGGDAANRTGSWSFMYGVGCRGNIGVYPDAGPDTPPFKQDYPGFEAKIATNATSPLLIAYTNYQGATWNGSIYVAGNGNGTYTIGAGSVAKNAFTIQPHSTRFDAAGNARGLSGLTSSGAFL